MKFEINAMANTFVKRLKYSHLFLYILAIIDFLSLIFGEYEATASHMMLQRDIDILLFSFKGIDILKGFSSFFFLYQLFFSVYSFIIYYLYENTNSPEFIKLRTSIYYIYFIKFIVITLFTLLIRSIYFIFNYFLFHQIAKIGLLEYKFMIINHILLMAIMYLITLIVTFIRHQIIRKKAFK